MYKGNAPYVRGEGVLRVKEMGHTYECNNVQKHYTGNDKAQSHTTITQHTDATQGHRTITQHNDNTQ